MVNTKDAKPEDAGEWSCVVDPNFGTKIGHIFDIVVVDGINAYPRIRSKTIFYSFEF